ncbi:MAG: hypothetical protein WCW03_01880 [Candidatus Paceibacterota bacterium]|jgi:hypothetical protein
MNDDMDSIKRVSIVSHGPDSVEFKGLTEEEVEKMQGMLGGGYYVRGDNGRLSFTHGWQPQPHPFEDTEMLPFWRRPTPSEGERATTPELFELEKLEDHTLPSISIQHLCGYHYSEEGYQRNARTLESFGFECMRSRRGDDGRYWEIWYLPGLWAVEGELKKMVGKIRDRQNALELALDFIRTQVSFGTLDVCVQRLAMPNPD